MKKATLGDKQSESYTKIILDDVDRLEEMVRQIEEFVQFSKFYTYNFQKLDIIPLIEKGHDKALTELNETSAARVSYKLHAPDKLPRVTADPEAIKEVFYNLLLNAYEAMPKGGKLTVNVRNLNSVVAVAIRDTGVGIKSEDSTDIFNPFFTGKMSGAGMGLSKVQLLVEEHRGRVQLQSELNKGSTFEVLLPVDRLSNGALSGEAVLRTGPIS